MKRSMSPFLSNLFPLPGVRRLKEMVVKCGRLKNPIKHPKSMVTAEPADCRSLGLFFST